MLDVDAEVRKLKEALAVSEWHFRDAVEDLMERYSNYEYCEIREGEED